MNTVINCTTEISEHLQLCLPRLPLDQPHTTRIDALGLDSMDTVELLCVIHEEFGVRLTESDLHPQQTIAGLLSVIARKRSN